jgi:hypothetical protein
MAEISFTVDLSRDLTLVTATGKISFQEIKDTISQYSKQKVTKNVLLNFIQANASEISIEEFKSIHYHSLGQFPNNQNRKIAVVVGNQLGFGISRMSETYGQITNPNNRYRTFYSTQEALNWLQPNQATDNKH